MELKGETLPLCLLHLQVFDSRIVKLHLPGAFHTNYMIMMLIFPVEFISIHTVTEGHFVGDARFSQQLQGPVNCGLADAWVRCFDGVVKLFGGNMTPVIQEGLKDQPPLRCQFQVLP